MLTLDDEDYELLGYGQERQYEEEAAFITRTLDVQARAAKENYKLDPQTRENRLEQLKRWRRREPTKYRNGQRKYWESDKGKVVKARAWAKYYEKNRAELVRKNKERRAAQKAKSK